MVLRDKHEQPVFPRWSAYFNIWVAALLAPGCLVIFFRTGPFAWNGLFAFWVPLTAFGSWFVVMAVLLFRAITAQQYAEIEARSQIDFDAASTAAGP